MEKKETDLPKEKNKSVLEISEKTRAELSALFNGEEWNGEKLPPVYLKLFSGPHETAKDAEGVKPLLDKADIYIPEVSEWSQKTLSIFRRISNGEQFPPDPDEFQEKLEEYVFGTKKPITFVDVPKEEVASHPEMYEDTEMYVRKLKYLSYEEATETFFKYIEKFSERDVINREAYMANHFAEKIKEIMLLHPELQKKDAIHILETLGSGHSSLYQLMKEIGGNHVSRVFRYNAPSRGLMSEATRRMSFKKDVSENLKKRALSEGIFLDGIGYLLDRLSNNTSKKEYFLRYIISLFSENETKEAFQLWKEYDGNPAEILYFIMMKKGIVFPENEEEMDVILSQTPYGKYQKTLEEMKKKKEEKFIKSKNAFV